MFVGKITSFDECKKPLEGTIYANIPATGQKVGISISTQVGFGDDGPLVKINIRGDFFLVSYKSNNI